MSGSQSAALGSLLILAAGCGGLHTTARPNPTGLAWPPGDPRVVLERVIEPRYRGGFPRRGMGGGLLSRLTGRRAAPLFHRPYALAWQGDSLLVADPDAGYLARIGDRGRVSVSRPGLFQTPIGVAVCGGGIVVSDAAAGKVALLDDDLALERWLAVDLARPTGVACDATRIFVVETAGHRIVVLEAGGGRRTLGRRGSGPGELNFPTAVCVDAASLWVGDTLNFRLQRFDPTSGEVLEVFGRIGDAAGEMPRVKGLAVDHAGHLWLSDGYLDQVSLYQPDGIFLMALGGRGAAAGEFSFPAGIAAHPDGRVAVVDSLNRRVQVFRTVTRHGAGHGAGHGVHLGARR